jgi:polar amino acid transport system substrate-binding protein
MFRLVAGAGLRRVLGILIAVAAIGLLRSNAADAQRCGTDYAIKEGESLAQIAARIYGNPAQWTIIFYANQDNLGANISLLVPGLALKLPLQPLPPEATTPAQAPTSGPAFIISSLVRRVEFLTADGLAPYTGRSLEGGGMLTQLINTAIGLVKDEGKGRFDYGVSWVNDWSAHLSPLLLTRSFDVGFPWARPNCDAGDLDEASRFRCERFFFSEPLYEEITRLFVLNGSRIRSLRNEEVAGATLCRAVGQPIHELDEQGRKWVKDGRVLLMRPPTVDECFRLLQSGAVHAVVEGELVGRASVTSLGMVDRVRMIEQPIALTTYHALISKSHPHATIIIYYVNSSLERLRNTGEYDRLIERHLTRFWEAQGAPHPAISSTPAVVAPANKDAGLAPSPKGKADITKK